MLETLGILGGLLALASCAYYIRDTLLLRIKPQRATFFIWSTLGAIAFFSQLAKGASSSLWLPGLETFGVIAIFLISIKYGVGGFGKQDYIALLVAGLGLIAWYLTKEAAIALYLVIFIDTVGLSLTIHKAYVFPDSEKHFAWLLSAIGGLLSLISVGSFDIILLSYPFYIMIANAAVMVALVLGKKRKSSL